MTEPTQIAAAATYKLLNALGWMGDYVHSDKTIAATVKTAILAALKEFAAERPAPQPGWESIETAPKDGSHILVTQLGHHGFGFCGAKYQDRSAVVHWWGAVGEEGWYLSLGNDDSEITWATHWKPIEAAPPAPAQAGKEAEK